MITIKNADGSLAPLFPGNPHDERSLELSLVSQKQEKAEIHFFELSDVPDSSVYPKSYLDRARPLGQLTVKNLPENPFGELRIRLALRVDRQGTLNANAYIFGERVAGAMIRRPSMVTPPSRHEKGGLPGGGIRKQRSPGAKSASAAFSPGRVRFFWIGGTLLYILGFSGLAYLVFRPF